MLMKCSKCGYENQLNAIFCRGCGEKMNPTEVTPDTLAEEALRRKKESRKINWKPIVGLVALALVVTYVILLFVTPSDAPVYTANPAVQYEPILKDIQDGYTVTVTPEQMTAFFNEYHMDKRTAESGDNYTIRDVVFTGNGNLLTVTIHTTVLNCDVTLTVVGTLKKGPDSNPILFEITDFSFGKTFLLFGRDSLLKKFDNIFYAVRLREMFRRAQDVTFANGQLIIVQQEKVVEEIKPRKKPVAKGYKKGARKAPAKAK